MSENKRLLTPEEIGDNLDLEVDGTYPCSDGSSTSTVSVDKLLEAQLTKAEPIIRAETLKELVVYGKLCRVDDEHGVFISDKLYESLMGK